MSPAFGLKVRTVVSLRVWVRRSKGPPGETSAGRGVRCPSRRCAARYGLRGHADAHERLTKDTGPRSDGQSERAGGAGRASAGAAGAVFPTSDAGATKERLRSEEGRQRLPAARRE